MSSLLERRTPAQLLWIIAVANALIVSGIAGILVMSWQLPEGLRLPWTAKLPWLALLSPGFIAGILAEVALQRGVAHKQWPEALLATPRKLLEHPAVSVLGWSLIVASFAAIVFSRGHHVSGAWSFLIPQLSIARVQFSLRSPANADDSSLIYPAKPLQSENWGAPPRPFSG
jgi:hypothetical protein